MNKIVIGLCIFTLTTLAQARTIADLEDLALAPESYWNGSDLSGPFSSRGVASFANNYDVAYQSWDGFAYSNLTDSAVAGTDAQFGAIPGTGAAGDKNYALGYVSAFSPSLPTITLAQSDEVEGAFFSNDNYTYYSMRDGDAFAKQFGASDWYQLTVTGLDAAGAATGTVVVPLAQGTDILNTWRWTDLSSLGTVKQLTFSLSSSDTGDWGMNTPSYFAMDNLTVVPEPLSISLLAVGGLMLAARRRRA